MTDNAANMLVQRKAFRLLHEYCNTMFLNQNPLKLKLHQL